MNQFERRLERLERLAGMGAKLYVIWLTDTNRVIRVDTKGHGEELLPGDREQHPSRLS